MTPQSSGGTQSPHDVWLAFAASHPFLLLTAAGFALCAALFIGVYIGKKAKPSQETRKRSPNALLEWIHGNPVWFITIIISIGILYVYVVDYRIPDKSLPGTLWPTIVGLTILIYLITTITLSYAPKRFKDHFFELVLHFLLALVSGAVIETAIKHLMFTKGAEPGFHVDDLTGSLVIGGIIFAIGVVGRSAEYIEDLRDVTEQASDLAEAADRAVQAVTEARFSGLAARLLGVREDALRRERGGDDAGKGDFDIGIVDGAEQGIEALRTWIASGQKLGEDFSDDNAFLEDGSKPGPKKWANTARQAWWRAMKVYHKEETYDVAALELATNIRNYAYILLAVIAECLRGVREANPKRQSRTGSRKPKYKLVVANVSGFAPKDFYNYPDGAKGNRFYHEAEFFGTYRRALAQVVSDRDVYPLRLLLAVPNRQPNHSQGHEGAHRNRLGWTLDSFDQLVLDCARLRVLPLPITVKFPPKDNESDLGARERNEIGMQFPPARDPANCLPSSIRRFLWVPTFVDFTRFDLGKAGNEPNFRMKWFGRAAAFEDCPRLDLTNVQLSSQTIKEFTDQRAKWRLTKFTDNLEAEVLPRYFPQGGSHGHRVQDPFATQSSTSASSGLLAKHSQATWFGVGNALSNWSAKGKESIAALFLSKVFVAQWDQMSKGKPPWVRLVANIDLQLSSQEGLWKDAETRQTVARCLASILGAAWWERSLAYAAEKKKNDRNVTDALFSFFEECQRIDTLLQVTRLQKDAGDKDDLSEIASTGVQMGRAESWLHRSLIQHEAIRRREQLNIGTIPLWRLLMTDLCGVEDDLSNANGLSRAVVQQKFTGNGDGSLLSHFRICEIESAVSLNVTEPSESSNVNPLSEEYMRENDILSEFLMVGVYPLGYGRTNVETGMSRELAAPEEQDGSFAIEKVKWIALVGAEMSEPLHTCRVQLRFAHEDSACKESICVLKHGNWLREVWETSRQATEGFLTKVVEEDPNLQATPGIHKGDEDAGGEREAIAGT